MIDIHPATMNHLADALDWLKAEEKDTGEGFYCNRDLIAESFAKGEGLCAVAGDRTVGFAVWQLFSDGGDVHIIEVKPTLRGQGIGSKLFLATIEALRKSGVKYIDAECTSRGGEALCRRHAFEDYSDPRNRKRPAIPS